MKGAELGDRIIGDALKFSFEERVFHFSILFGAAMTAVGILINLYYGTSALMEAIFTGYWILAYYISRYKRHYKVISVVSVGVLVFAFIPYIWITTRGGDNGAIYYSLVFVAVICILLKGYLRIAMVLSALAVQLILIWFASGDTEGVRKVTDLDTSILFSFLTSAMAVLIIIYSNTYRKEKQRSELYSRTIEEQYQQQLYYMESLEELIYKLKSERHDFNNHLGVIYGLLESGESDKASSYVTRLVKTVEEYQSIVNVPYPMVRAMLNYKLSTAKDENIELKLNINIPKDLDLNEFDLVVILGNLLDNAVEACKRVDTINRYIDLRIIYRPIYLIITVANQASGEPARQDDTFRTTKPDVENHGFGLENIKYLVNKHNGFIKVDPYNGIFKVNIALLVNEQS